MGKLDNNFEQRLKRYSEEIKSMQIVYREGRVKCINKKDRANFKDSILKNEHTDIKSFTNEDDIIIDKEDYYIFKSIYRLILKFIFIFTILMSIPFIANRFTDMGISEFISGTSSILISYFIITIICILT